MHHDREDTDEDATGLQGESGGNLHDVTLSVDAVLSLLASHRRRALIGYLVDAPDRTASLDDCVRHLTECVAARTGTRPGQDQVEATLHHVHVPKLVDAGLVEYDPRSQRLRYRTHDGVEAWLERIRAHESERD